MLTYKALKVKRWPHLSTSLTYNTSQMSTTLLHHTHTHTRTLKGCIMRCQACDQKSYFRVTWSDDCRVCRINVRMAENFQPFSIVIDEMVECFKPAVKISAWCEVGSRTWKGSVIVTMLPGHRWSWIGFWCARRIMSHNWRSCWAQLWLIARVTWQLI